MATKNPTRCSIDGCDRDARSRGMCSRHYSNLARYGHAVPRREWSTAQTLDYIGWDITSAGCWEWRGGRNELGYGILTIVRQGHDRARVHRLMYERQYGEIPEGMVVRHVCDNPPCVNPEHLVKGTQQENVQDMIDRRRHWRHDVTECLNGHDLTRPSSFRIAERKNRRPERVCFACQKERHQRFQEKNIRKRKAS